MELELGLEPDDAARLLRLGFLAPLRSGKARSRPVRIVWHDSPDRTLVQQGLALAEQRPEWRLERLHPDTQPWPPGMPSPVLETARDPSVLGHALPNPLVPVAAFEGRSTSLTLVSEQAPVALTLMRGVVRAVAGEHLVCRVRLDGPASAVQALAMALTGELRLALPRTSLAGEAIAVAMGVPASPRREGAAELPAGLSMAAAFSYVVGHLTDVILYFAPVAAQGQDGPEPVHQMRVAVRRLRSTIKVFRRAVNCPDVDAVDGGLKALADKLAPTRDWDVFVTETGAAVADAFPTEKRLQRLLAAAERCRRTCHDELRAVLIGPEFRRLGIELACLAGSQEWQANLVDTERAELDAPLEEFAARLLNRRLKRLWQVEGDINQLEPAAMHAIRLRAKRLRYAAEIFAPLYRGKTTSRFIRQLTTLQNRLGTLNDAAVASSLLGELARNGGQAFANGLVLGFVGARGERTRKRISQAWEKLRRVTPFWS
jgi:triphosphatase